jgi:hypothetical protein
MSKNYLIPINVFNGKVQELHAKNTNSVYGVNNPATDSPYFSSSAASTIAAAYSFT